MRINRSGMTLMEISIVAVILVIVASLAIPNYLNVVEETRASEAKSNLRVIATAQKIFKANNGPKKYYPAAGGSASTATAAEFADMKSKLNVDFTSNYYTIVVSTASGGSTTDYSAVATRNNSTKSYTLDPATGGVALTTEMTAVVTAD